MPGLCGSENNALMTGTEILTFMIVSWLCVYLFIENIKS